MPWPLYARAHAGPTEGNPGFINCWATCLHIFAPSFCSAQAESGSNESSGFKCYQLTPSPLTRDLDCFPPYLGFLISCLNRAPADRCRVLERQSTTCALVEHGSSVASLSPLVSIWYHCCRLALVNHEICCTILELFAMLADYGGLEAPAWRDTELWRGTSESSTAAPQASAIRFLPASFSDKGACFWNEFQTLPMVISSLSLSPTAHLQGLGESGAPAPRP